jgi:NAD(P)-dependent dehydrogenase (short-subunit alcohol dehydrogenase family)
MTTQRGRTEVVIGGTSHVGQAIARVDAIAVTGARIEPLT